MRNYFFERTAPLLAAFFVAACSGPTEGTATDSVAATDMDSLVTAEWLTNNMDDPDLVILDCTVMIEVDEDGGFRSVNGRANYTSGHIPGARFADLMDDLSDPDSELGYAVPSPEYFAAAMESLGVSDNSRVVLYDANGSAWAARVWWMLRWIGFDNTALLDGGLNAWTEAGGALSTEAPDHPRGQLTVNLRPELIVDKEEVLAAIDDESINIVDALPEPQYRGETEMYARPGHIAGAANLPVFSLLDDSRRYKSHEELQSLVTFDKDKRTINYCGGGIAASSNAFVLTRLGYENVSVYTASLQEWAADPNLPMETAEDPGTSTE